MLFFHHELFVGRWTSDSGPGDPDAPKFRGRPCRVETGELPADSSEPGGDQVAEG